MDRATLVRVHVDHVADVAGTPFDDVEAWLFYRRVTLTRLDSTRLWFLDGQLLSGFPVRVLNDFADLGWLQYAPPTPEGCCGGCRLDGNGGCTCFGNPDCGVTA